MQMKRLQALGCGLVAVLVIACGVACKSGPEDATITTNVKAKLLADPSVSGTAINVDTKEGVVTLTGTVDNDAAKAKAESIAKGVEGVKSVKANLTVKPPAPPTPTADASNDTAIRSSVMANLTKAGVTGVTVDVKDGVVTLKGTVAKADLPKAKQAADEATPKPKQVINELATK